MSDNYSNGQFYSYCPGLPLFRLNFLIDFLTFKSVQFITNEYFWIFNIIICKSFQSTQYIVRYKSYSQIQKVGYLQQLYPIVLDELRSHFDLEGSKESNIIFALDSSFIWVLYNCGPFIPEARLFLIFIPSMSSILVDLKW